MKTSPNQYRTPVRNDLKFTILRRTQHCQNDQNPVLALTVVVFISLHLLREIAKALWGSFSLLRVPCFLVLSTILELINYFPSFS